MPRRLTRPEVVTRIAIKALIDARPSIKRRQLITLFHVSSRTVTDAARYPVSRWMVILATAPATSKPHRMKAVTQQVATFPTRPGSRERARLEEPEPMIDIPEVTNFDEPAINIDDAAMEQAITDALEAMDQEMRGVLPNRKVMS